LVGDHTQGFIPQIRKRFLSCHASLPIRLECEKNIIFTMLNSVKSTIRSFTVNREFPDVSSQAVAFFKFIGGIAVY
jgi:hypothetical protein